MAMRKGTEYMQSLDQQRTALAPARFSEAGFSLLEVMIALIVLAVGLLGLAAMQSFSLRYNNQSYQRSQATAAIADIVDRMRSNPAGVRAGVYVLPPTSIPPAAATDCNATSCLTASSVASFDMNQWITFITRPQVLGPAATGQIESVVAADPVYRYRITVTWQENNVQQNQQLVVQVP
jgi:type IV pilus assembly protein PilV